MTTVYIHKTERENGYIVFPVPSNLTDYYEVDVDELPDPEKVVFDPDSQTFIDRVWPVEELQQNAQTAREQEYEYRSDPLYLSWQHAKEVYGADHPKAITLHDAWLAEVSSIKAEHPLPIAAPEPTEAELYAEWKHERELQVANLVVEVDGMLFNGDEVSQTRMARVLSTVGALGRAMTDTYTWRLADNTNAQPTFEQLARALEKAGTEQANIWFPPEDLME